MMAWADTPREAIVRLDVPQVASGQGVAVRLVKVDAAIEHSLLVLVVHADHAEVPHEVAGLAG